MACLSCGRGFHWECESGCEDCHEGESRRLREQIALPNSVYDTKGGTIIKEPEHVKDRHSTGRKRAAELYPIIKHRACEWRGKKNCGGGIPIVGCVDGKQVDRHHGPIKDTLENTPGNVHRICKKCHNRWHTVNDGGYEEEKWAETKHEPQPAEEIELLANEVYWQNKQLRIVKDTDADH